MKDELAKLVKIVDWTLPPSRSVRRTPPPLPKQALIAKATRVAVEEQEHPELDLDIVCCDEDQQLARPHLIALIASLVLRSLLFIAGGVLLGVALGWFGGRLIVPHL